MQVNPYKKLFRWLNHGPLDKILLGQVYHAEDYVDGGDSVEEEQRVGLEKKVMEKTNMPRVKLITELKETDICS